MTDCSDWESARGLRGAFVVFQTRLDVTIMASDPRIINYFILFEFRKFLATKIATITSKQFVKKISKLKFHVKFEL